MKKLLLLFVSVLTLGLTSCSEDDGTEDQGIDANASIEGKWIYSKEGGIVGGSEQYIDYEHQEGCPQDYTQISAGGAIEDVGYEGDDCTESTLEGQWSRSGNMVSLDFNGQTYNAEIVTLTNSTLKIKFEEGGQTLFTVYTKG